MEDRFVERRCWRVVGLARVRGLWRWWWRRWVCLRLRRRLGGVAGDSSLRSRSKRNRGLRGDPNFHEEQMSGKIGETVEYQIVVKNTGGVPLGLGKFGE